MGEFLSQPDIFISHARPDAETARRFASAFRAEGFDVWWDEALQTGAVFDEAIEEALNGAKAVVVLWSPDSVVSRWVRAEATVADQNNTLLPVMIKACRRPVIFELTQTADLTRWKGNRKDRAWRAFVEDARSFIELRSDDERSHALAAHARRRTGSETTWFAARFSRLHLSIIASVAVIALLTAGLTWWHRQGETAPDAPLSIGHFQAQSGPQAAQFAQALQNDVVNVMQDAGVPITTVFRKEDRPAMVLNGSVVEAAGILKAFAQIQDAKSGVTLWSQQFQGKTANSDRMGIQMAVAAAEPFYALREINLQKGLKSEPGDLAKLIKANQLIDNPRQLDEGMLQQTLSEAAAEVPESAYAHGMLALSLVQDGARAPADERAMLFDRARSEAGAAIKISPAASGGAYDALYLISVYTQRGNIARQENLLLDGVRSAPGSPHLTMRQCQFLLSVGRNEDAFSYCQRAHAMRPLSAPIEWRFAKALKMRGNPALAEQAIEQALTYYPQNGLVRLAAFDIRAFGPASDRAAPLLLAMLNQADGFGDEQIDALKLYLLARRSGNPADIDRAAEAIRAAVHSGLRFDLAIKVLVSLGRNDAAFELLDALDSPLAPEIDLAPANPGSSFLFAPETAPLRADVRFWAVAKRQGLVAYWKTTRKWPDFCGKEMPVDQCRVAADKVSTAAS